LSITVSGLKSAELSRKSGVTYVEATEEWQRSRNLSEATSIELCINHYPDSLVNETTRRFLIVIEPTITWPSNALYLPEEYERVFAAGPISGAQSLEWFHEPSNEAPDISLTEFNTKVDKFTILASNKLSFIRGELYSLRREVARSHSNSVDLYGYDWNNSLFAKVRKVVGEVWICLCLNQKLELKSIRCFFFRFRNYKGSVQSKLGPYARNKYALVIENSMELRTEKLYDAVEAGAIPIYVGPDVEADVPKQLFISAKPNLAAVSEAMKDAQRMDANEWLNERKKWMQSPSYRRTSKERFFRFLDQEVNG